MSVAHGKAESYQHWLRKYEPALFWPEQEIAQSLGALTYQPLFSILLPTYNSDPDFLAKCVCSVRRQHYPNWQLCAVDDGSRQMQAVDYLRKAAAGDKRIQVRANARNAGISAASNDALAMAAGEFVVLLDHDDELHPFALAEVARALNERADRDLIYSDEDKLDRDGNRVCPAFKPDFDSDIFLAFDYLGHLIALRRSVAVQVGGFRSDCDGAQDWDLLMRSVEIIAAERIHHIPKPLYHWRMHGESTALDLNAKPQVRQAWNRTLGDHVTRTQTGASIEPGLFPGSMRLKRGVPESIPVAVVLRTEDGPYQQAALTWNCGAAQLVFYEALGNAIYRGSQRVWSGSEIKEEILLFINRPLETINHSFLHEIIGQALRPDCGLVTGLSIDNRRVIHSGLVRQSNGGLIDPFANQPFPSHCYMGQLSLVRRVDAISDEFYAMRRSFFLEAGGLGLYSTILPQRVVEQFGRAARRAGLRTLVTPYAVATLEWATQNWELLHSEPGPGVDLNPNLTAFKDLPDAMRGNL